MNNLVSIIVPVYNAEAYIEETITRVLCQTYLNWELLLVDDCSTDNGKAKIEAFCKEDERIRFIQKEKNEGAALTRNAGLRIARGRYIAFLDADDIWLPEKLEKELIFMQERQAAFAFTSYEFGDENGKGLGKVVSVPEIFNYKEALSKTIIFTSTVLFDTDKIEKNLLEMPHIKSEDTATWWRILKSGYTAYGLNDVLVIYRRPGKSLSSNKAAAMKRIWNLYRKEEKISLLYSIYNFVLWAWHATIRRI